MKRRNFLKAFLAAPFAGLLKKTPKAAKPLNPKDDDLVRLQIEAAEKAANPPMYLDAMDVPDEEWQRNYDRVMCIDTAAYAVYPDGKVESISRKDFYK